MPNVNAVGGVAVSVLLQTITPLAQADNIWILGPAALKLLPTLLNVTVGKVDCATNLYHTSADVVALPLQVAANAVAFAPSNVPEVVVQVGPVFSKTAVAQVACDCVFPGKNKVDNRRAAKTLVSQLLW